MELLDGDGHHVRFLPRGGMRWAVLLTDGPTVDADVKRRSGGHYLGQIAHPERATTRWAVVADNTGKGGEHWRGREYVTRQDAAMAMFYAWREVESARSVDPDEHLEPTRAHVERHYSTGKP